MTIKWATFVFWTFLDPLFRLHHRYYRRKVELDRFLERRSFSYIAGLGILFGTTLYLSVGRLLPGGEGRSFLQHSQDCRDLLKAHRMQYAPELPILNVFKIRAETLALCEEARDRAIIESRK